MREDWGGLRVSTRGKGFMNQRNCARRGNLGEILVVLGGEFWAGEDYVLGEGICLICLQDFFWGEKRICAWEGDFEGREFVLEGFEK